MSIPICIFRYFFNKSEGPAEEVWLNEVFFLWNMKEPDSTEGHTTGHVAQPQPPRLEDVKKWNGGTNSPKGLWIRLFDRWLYPPPVNTERSP